MAWIAPDDRTFQDLLDAETEKCLKAAATVTKDENNSIAGWITAGNSNLLGSGGGGGAVPRVSTFA